VSGRPLRGLLRRRHLQSEDLHLAVSVVSQEAIQLRALGALNQADLLDESVVGLRQRIALDEARFDAARRAKRGGVSNLWFHFLAEEIAGVPEFGPWFSGRLPVLSSKWLQTSNYVVGQFNVWRASRKKGSTK
jgi:hypothetical protein